LYSDDSWTIVEDFAHHPTAVVGAIEAVRAAYPDRKLTVCFEPRSNTASSARLQTEFQSALSVADRVYFGAVYRADRMRPEERLDTVRLANALPDSKAFTDNQSLLEALKMCVSDEAHGLIVFLTNGSFDGLPSLLVASCSNAR
ncbi:MAG: cyanophycin synthetase, partial [Verrucomicrobiota bacterium]|nr:cyanophycin synthetase [Verrucomicrobiota bacterium]